MRIKKKKDSGQLDSDLTPMIDMTFQLIAFFMVLINFTQSEQDDRVKLPESELAKPPDAQIENPITLHLTEEGQVVIAGQVVHLEGLRPYLAKEKSTLEFNNKTTADATVIIRAHKNAQTGKVQELIKVCQENNFEKFALRAKEDVGN